MKDSIIRDAHFEPVSEAKVDAKNRVSLPKGSSAHTYRVYRNDAGQILLEPQVLIPAAEAWLYENKKALASVRRGLADAKAGRVHKMKSVAGHAEDPIE